MEDLRSGFEGIFVGSGIVMHGWYQSIQECRVLIIVSTEQAVISAGSDAIYAVFLFSVLVYPLDPHELL